MKTLLIPYQELLGYCSLPQHPERVFDGGYQGLLRIALLQKRIEVWSYH